jgi:hypothetical protein
MRIGRSFWGKQKLKHGRNSAEFLNTPRYVNRFTNPGYFNASIMSVQEVVSLI